MMLVPRRDLDLFDDFFDDAFYGVRNNKVMRTDIKEHDDSFELISELPGFEKNDISLDIENGYLTISAKTNVDNNNEEKGKYVRRERYYGEFSRSFYVGENITEEDIKATFKNGILNILIPKVDTRELDRKKHIEIGE